MSVAPNCYGCDVNRYGNHITIVNCLTCQKVSYTDFKPFLKDPLPEDVQSQINCWLKATPRYCLFSSKSAMVRLLLRKSMFDYFLM